MSTVSLREITRENFREILRLKVADEQTEFVASNAYSIAEAHYQAKAWIRGVYAGETPVGFVMLHDDPDEPRYFLLRFMIAAEHQGKGYGKAALDRLVEYVRVRPNAAELQCSYVPGDGGPAGFYAKYGFVETGEVAHGENVISLALG
jgi:diamine N-acetyltransferase